jgi:membrane fusion protein (multidrug efflux system)
VPELESTAHTASAQAGIAERDAARQQELLKEGITSKREADARAAEAASARSAAEAASQLLARARVTSPIAGIVQRVAAHPGERVDAGALLIEVIDPSTLDLVAAVPAAALARIRVGAAALVRSEGAGRALPGRVQAIAPAVDSLTNSGQVVVRVPNPGRALRAGEGATALVIVEVRKRALVVPDSAIVVLGDSLAVFVVGADSVAKAHDVGVGTRRNGRAEILRGIAPGDRIVVSGAFGLSDGMKVVFGAPARP